MVKPTELRYKVGGQHFPFEQVWQLDGLVNAWMLNGKLCIVKRPTNRPGETPGRLKVKVLSQPDPVHVKPKNLKAVDVEAYEALSDHEKVALRMHSFTHHAIEDIDTERGGYTMRTDSGNPGGVYLTHGFHAEAQSEPEPEADAEPEVGMRRPFPQEEAGDDGAAAVGSLTLGEGSSTDGTPDANTALGDRFGTCGQKNA